MSAYVSIEPHNNHFARRRNRVGSDSVTAKGEYARMKILSVTSEIYPLIKTGGLADVTGSLPKALAPLGIETTSLVPGYPKVMQQLGQATTLMEFEDLLGEKATLRHGHVEGLDLLVLDAPALYNRPGGPYVDQHGKDHPDNWKRFAVLSLAAAEIAGHVVMDAVPPVRRCAASVERMTKLATDDRVEVAALSRPTQ